MTSVLLALTLSMGLGAASAQVAKVPHLHDIKIVDANGVDWTNKTLVAGGEYVIQFSVIVEVGQPESELIISTTLDKVEPTYWTLENNYPGIDTSTWRPGLNTFKFDAVEGQADITVVGKVPEDVTQVHLDKNITLHREVLVRILGLSLVATGEVLDSKQSTITDIDLMEFDEKFAQKTSAVNDAIVDQRYRNFYQNMLNAASDLRAFGDLRQATGLLDAMPHSTEFIPPSEAGYTFIFTTVGLGVTTALFIVLWNRNRSLVHYTYRQVGSKSKELDLVLVKLNRLDKSIADIVAGVKDDLDRISKNE